MEVIEKYKDLVKLRDVIKKELDAEVKRQNDIHEEILIIEKVHEIILMMREHFINQVKEKFERIQNLALNDIINDRDYKFVLDITPRRGKPNVDLFIDKRYEGKTLRAKLENSGDGVKSVLRIASTVSLNLLSGRRRVLAFDEEMTAISKDHQNNNYLVNSMRWLKKICDEFDIQLIFITHEDFLRDFADQTIVVIAEQDGSAKVKTQYRKLTEVTNG